MPRRPPQNSHAPVDPAELTARLLMRIGFGVLAIAVPAAAAFSRRSIFILLPFGAGLIILATTVVDLRTAAKRLLDRLLSPIGLAALLLAIWAGLSILWAPDAGDAGIRLFKLAGTAVLAAIAVAFLPERMRLSTLYLLPIGIAAAAATTLVFGIYGGARLAGATEVDAFTISRGAITLVVLIWPALAALATRRRTASAGALAICVIAAAIAARTPGVLLGLCVGGLAFAAAVVDQRRTAFVAAIVSALLLLFAPLLPLIVVAIAKATSGGIIPEQLMSFATWSHIVRAEEARLITGHGLETHAHGLAMGYLPATTPRSILFEIWYELGVVGAVVLAFVAAAAFLSAERAGAGVARYLIAALATVITLAVFSENAAQLWWVTLLAVAAICFGGVINGQYRTRRPILRPVIEPKPPHSVP